MTSNPFKWHGGKWYLADWLISLQPPKGSFVHRVETHGGGAAFTLAQQADGISEVVNDINLALTNFWCVLQDPEQLAQMQRYLQAVPFSQREWEAAVQSEDFPSWFNAAQFFIQYRQSRQGIGKSFATLSKSRTRRGINEQAASWLSAIEGLPEAHHRLQGVVILDKDALEVIKSEDSDKTLFYCDPPYHHGTRKATDVYEFEMTEEQHGDLLITLSEIEGKFMLSGYHSKMYDDWADACGWRLAEKRIDNKASSAPTKEVKTECVWMNY